MRLLGLEVRRYAQTDPPEGVSGADIDENLQAALTGGADDNPALNGREKYRTYNEMRKTDPSVKSTLWLFKQPLRSGVWRVEPCPDPEPVDHVIADAARWQFGLEKCEGQLDLSWLELVSQSLLMFDFGAMFEEQVWGDVTTWRDADGDEHTMRPLARLAPRMPATVEKLESDAKTGALTRLTQDIPGARPVRGDKLQYHVLDREGTDFWGTSLLRAMWGAWRMKKTLTIASGIGWDRHGAGTPVVRYPSGGGTAERQQAERIGRTYRNHERGYIVLEGSAPLAATGGQGWDVEILNGANSLADPVPLLRWYSAQIAASGLQQFSDLGTSESGSRAVGDVLVEPFYQAVETIAAQMATDLKRQSLRRFVDVNFGTEFATPSITCGKIQSRNIVVLARALADLSSAGFNFTDPGVQGDLRETLRFPTLDDADIDVGVESSSPASNGRVSEGELPGVRDIPV